MRVGMLAIVVAAFAIAAPVRADFDGGLAAYRRGDYAAAASSLASPAAQGDPRAQYLLGALYGQGQGVDRDLGLAAAWTTKAAESRFPPAELELGNLYFMGVGVPKDYARAAIWYKRAGEHNLPIAWSNLGLLYASGRGVPQDRQQALNYVGKAATAGVVQAQLALAFLYDLGGTLSPELMDELMFPASAAKPKPDSGTAASLAASLSMASEEDRAEATKWFREAADRGVPLAQAMLAVRYRSGLGTKRDLVQAYKWSALASAAGTRETERDLRDLEKQMSDAQLAEARKLVEDWKRDHPPNASPDAARAVR